MTLAFLLLLLGSAAAFLDRKMEREDNRCKQTFTPPDYRDDADIESCLQIPEIAAVADGFTGTEADKRLEIGGQCVLKEYVDFLFTGGVLDPEKVKQHLERVVKSKGLDASVMQGIDDCFSILQEPYHLLAFTRCVTEYC